MPHVRILQIDFNFDIAPYEVPAFRGAVIEHVGREVVAFHNHIGEEGGFVYAYPHIQYKRIGKQASILCLNDGIEEIYRVFSQETGDVMIGDRKVSLNTKHIRVDKPLVQVWDKVFSYRLSKWLALNEANYKKYQQLESISSKSAMLERILTGNILSFAKGIQWAVEKDISVLITDITATKLVTYKGSKLLAFDLQFNTNVYLPKHIGLGKGASTGFGVVFTAAKPTQEILHDLNID